MANETWRKAFLASLSAEGVVQTACKAAGVGRSTAYRHRDADPAFARAWDDATDDATDDLETEARRRGLVGIERPVYYRGTECGRIRTYSDTLLMRQLKAHRPELYRDHFDAAKLLSVEASPPTPDG